MSEKNIEIELKNVPEHVAVIMDGNGRWAKNQGKARIFGHNNALTAVRETVEGCAEMGVKNLTLYAFSAENWKRPKLEVQALMQLLVRSINNEIPTLNKNNIRLLAIGDIHELPSKTYKELLKGIKATKDNTHMNLILALNYSGRKEIIKAVKNIAIDSKDGKLEPENIDEKTFSNYLYTANIPDPELMIRTSGEYRISNFLLWQMAYTELVFIDKYWPDFRKTDLIEALLNFQNRERRFGKTGDQLT